MASYGEVGSGASPAGIVIGSARLAGEFGCTLCRVKPNHEHGEGRPDIVAYTGNRAIILELKCLLPSVISKLPLTQQFVKVPAMMNELLDEAETQIRTRYYIEGLMFEEPNITEVKAYAMCFCKKRCMVREVKGEWGGEASGISSVGAII